MATGPITAKNMLFCRIAVARRWLAPEQARELCRHDAFAGEIAVDRAWMTADQARTAVAVMHRFLDPKRVAGFEILSEIGRGGMGRVYRAVQMSMQRPVAVKVMLPQYALNPKAVDRFMREAQAAGRINHPNVICCYDVSEDRGILFMAMELMTGGDLRGLLDQCGGCLPLPQALSIACDCAKGLIAVERAGLVHRDIKPSNIFFNEDRVAKLADLGLVFDEDTAPGRRRACGTPAYMAPEQARGETVDIRADIYALGATLHEMLVGARPFEGADGDEILHKVCTQPLGDLTLLDPPLPLPVVTVLGRALAKDPLARYEHPADLLEDLYRLLERPDVVGDAATGLRRRHDRLLQRDTDHTQRPRSSAVTRTTSAGSSEADPFASAAADTDGDTCPQCGRPAIGNASLCFCGCDLDEWRSKRTASSQQSTKDRRRRAAEESAERERLERGYSVGAGFLEATREAEAKRKRKGGRGLLSRFQRDGD